MEWSFQKKDQNKSQSHLLQLVTVSHQLPTTQEDHLLLIRKQAKCKLKNLSQSLKDLLSK